MATTNDQYSQLLNIPPAPQDDDHSYHSYVSVRSNGSNTRYEIQYTDVFDYWNTGEHSYGVYVRKYIGGSPTVLFSSAGGLYVGIRLEVTGTTVVAKATTNGSTWTTVWSGTDAGIASGSTGYSTSYGAGPTWTEGDLAGGPVPGTCPLPVVNLSPTVGKMELQPGGIPVSIPVVPVSLSPAVGNIGASGLYVMPTPQFEENFEGYAPNTPLVAPWKTKIGMPVVINNGTYGKVVNAGATGDAYYTGVTGQNHYTSMRHRYGTGMGLIARGQWSTGVCYRATVGYGAVGSHGCNSYVIHKVRLNGSSTYLASVPSTAGQSWPAERVWFEASSLNDGAPVRLRLFGDGVLICEVWDDGSIGEAPYYGGYPGFTTGGGTRYYDDFATGVVGTPPTAGECPFPVISLDPAVGNLGEPQSSSVEVLPVALSPVVGDMGEAVPGSAEQLAVSLDPTIEVVGGKVSRVKQTSLYPSYSAFGGLNTYSNTQKGQICIGAERTIGYRVGLGNDGVKGDRVFFTVPANELLRSDDLVSPLGKVTLHLVFLAMQSWDYWAAGADANVTGDAFKIRRWDSGEGMNAVLSGDYGTIEARPIWLSGQTWYDGTTRGQPVWDCVVDVTALYNEAAQAGTELKFALDCTFNNQKWVAELVGNDPDMQWARPRLEVHRWGATEFSIEDADTSAPTVVVTTPAGATLAEIRWGYDPECTPIGGPWKYRPDDRDRNGGEIEGRSLTSPYTLPMLVSSSRIFVEAEIDYGAPGAQLFKRTFKTPQVLAPKLESTTDFHAIGSDAVVAPGTPADSRGWVDFRGPCLGPAGPTGDCYYALVKRYIPAWQEGQTYQPYDRVASNGVRWYTAEGGVSGTTAPVPTTAPVTNDGGVQWTRQAPNSNPHRGFQPATPDQPSPGYGWDLYRLVTHPLAYESRFKWIHTVGAGGESPCALEASPLPTAAITEAQTGQFGARAFSGRDLHVIADDVSAPVWDTHFRSVFFLASALEDGAYTVRLWQLDTFLGDTNSLTWGPSNWDKSFFTYKTDPLYTSPNPIDLSLATITRLGDYRCVMEADFHRPLVVSFMADAELRILVAPPWNTWITFTVADRDWRHIPATGWEMEQSIPLSDVTSVKAFHMLTRDNEHRTVIAAASASGGWIGSRSDDSADPVEGGGWTYTRGTWVSASLPFVRAWSTDTMPYNADECIPDTETVAIAVQAPDGAVSFRRYSNPGIESAGYAGSRSAALAPPADFTCVAEMSPAANRLNKAVWAWPATGAINDTGHPQNGGAAVFVGSGSSLQVQRVADFLRVSETKTAVLPSAIERIYAQSDCHWLEGMQTPVVTRHADGFRTTMVTVSQDPERMVTWRTSPINAVRFSSGTATPVKETTNMRDISRFVDITPVYGVSKREVKIIDRLVGHNCFTTSWFFDPNGGNPTGIMNEAGYLYFALKGKPGDRYRVLIPNSPLFGGIWKGGGIVGGNTSWGYQEVIGGFGWMNGRFSTWFWTNDPPNTPHRRWRRIQDGMDYVLDGESNGGMYVIDIRSPGATLYLAHDYVTDIALWKADVTRWRSLPNASRIKWMNAKGELLWGVGPNANVPLSEVAVDDRNITWVVGG